VLCQNADFDFDFDVDCADWTEFKQHWTPATSPPTFGPCP
jgi:hypothetical protein